MTTRHHNDGLRKICGCPRRQWRSAATRGTSASSGRAATTASVSTGRLGRHVDSKTDAEREATTIKGDIRAGRFGQPAARDGMTLRQLADTYLERYVAVTHPDTANDFRSGLSVICGTDLPRPTGGAVPFGGWGLADIVTDTIERYREARRATGTGVGGTNRSVSRLRALYNWAVRVGYVEATPFKRGTEPVIKLARDDAA